MVFIAGSALKNKYMISIYTYLLIMIQIRRKTHINQYLPKTIIEIMQVVDPNSLVDCFSETMKVVKLENNQPRKMNMISVFP